MLRRILDTCLVALTLVAGIAPATAAWDSPADRYLDAWKDYADARCPIGEDGIRHFVYFARERDALHDHAFLDHPRFSGAQIMYAWRELEPEPGRFDFSIIREDIDTLRAHGKSLFVQLQDATISPE
jgi:hypothetical protein